jgi:hypothetical protein
MGRAESLGEIQTCRQLARKPPPINHFDSRRIFCHPQAFEPYDSIKEENPEARAAGRALIEAGKAAGPKSRTFIYVNNRLEGNAISTIAAMVEPGES